MEHFPDCAKATEDYKKEVAEFEKKHPGYCRACRGHGGSWYRYDPSPRGVSLSPGYMEDFSECTECIEKGKCPWCGGKLDEKALENGDLICASKCGWVNDTETLGLPEEPECWCDYRRGFMKDETVQGEADKSS